MTTYTITTTTQEDSALQFALDKYNSAALLANSKATPLTAQQYLDFLIKTQWIASYQVQKDVETGESIKSAFISANAAKQAQVKTALGL